MWFSLWQAVTSPIGRWACAGVLVALLLAGAYLRIRSSALAEGEQKGKATVLNDVNAQLQASVPQLLEDLHAAHTRELEAAAEATKARQERDAAEARAQSLARQRQAEQDAISKMTDPEAQLDLCRRLQIIPCAAPWPWRVIDGQVAAAQALPAELDQLRTGIAKAKDENKALGDQIQALKDQRGAALQLVNEYRPAYTMAYNAAQKRNWFQRLFRLNGKKLDIPEPITLEEKAKKVSEVKP